MLKKNHPFFQLKYSRSANVRYKKRAETRFGAMKEKEKGEEGCSGGAAGGTRHGPGVQERYGLVLCVEGCNAARVRA